MIGWVVVNAMPAAALAQSAVPNAAEWLSSALRDDGFRLASPWESPADDKSTTASDDAGGIQDNSFFIEEAYNQDPRVVQHIFNGLQTWDRDDGTRTRRFDFTFTQEWPVGSQTHQLSYTVPVSWIAEHTDGDGTTHDSGVGDIALNYRYQALGTDAESLWFAPRFSVIVPTGDEDRGLGRGVTGYQVDLPFSREVGSFAFHLNAGATAFPNADAALDGGGRSRDHDLLGFNLGVSAILIESPVVQPLLEVVALVDHEIDEQGGLDRTTSVVASPGFRWSPYTHGETQIVVGSALPVGLTNDAADIGLFLYFSIEHGF
ncbi:MAG: transporter [Planctomycetes bacterium]|nr:transporter [Planctomycetota bacterium]